MTETGRAKTCACGGEVRAEWRRLGLGAEFVGEVCQASGTMVIGPLGSRFACPLATRATNPRPPTIKEPEYT